MPRNNTRYQPVPVNEFRKLYGPRNYAIPEVSERRRPTDLTFSIVFGLTMALSVCLLINAMAKADINRLTHGYDNCGNVCGSKNSKIDDVPCSGQDWTSKPYMQVDPSDEDSEYMFRTCVQKCEKGWVEIFNQCNPETDKNAHFGETLEKVASDLNRSAWYIVFFCFLGLGFSIGMLLLFRYQTAITIWVILAGSVLGVIAMTAAFWYADAKSANDPDLKSRRALRSLAITFTIVSLVIIIILAVLYKRIKLIIRLFKEAVKITFSMPLILLQPFLTSLAMFLLIVFFLVFILQIAAAGTLQEITYNYLYSYKPTGVMAFALCLHIIASLWMAQFIMGCQHMIIAGAVSAYYFSRDRSKVKSPIFTSTKNLVKFHLGTVAFGSLIVTVVAIIKALIRALVNNRCAKMFVDHCLGAIEDFLKYLSKNAYIETAIHGQPFYKSGKRAVSLLAANAGNAIAVNYVGDFIILMAELFIVTLTVFVAFLVGDDSIEYFGVGIVIAGAVTFIIAKCFFTVLEVNKTLYDHKRIPQITAIDTLFLCFCEDSCINDGMTRQYYMSRDLMQYMEDVKAQVKK